jgi:hypothetical protein
MPYYLPTNNPPALTSSGTFTLRDASYKLYLTMQVWILGLRWESYLVLRWDIYNV